MYAYVRMLLINSASIFIHKYIACNRTSKAFYKRVNCCVVKLQYVTQRILPQGSCMYGVRCVVFDIMPELAHTPERYTQQYIFPVTGVEVIRVTKQ